MLLKELLNLTEAELATIPVEEYWDQNEASSKDYVSSTIYAIKAPDGQAGKHFDVYHEINGKRGAPNSITKQQLNLSFSPIRPNQKPDAEGFIYYQSSKIIDAIKHTGQPVKIQNVDTTVTLNKNDYVTRQLVKNKFSFSVEKASAFENNFTKK